MKKLLLLTLTLLLSFSVFAKERPTKLVYEGEAIVSNFDDVNFEEMSERELMRYLYENANLLPQVFVYPQDTIRKLSNYEKYRIQKDRERFGEPDTTKTDTVYIVVEQDAEPVVINNYYSDYNQPNLRFSLTFGYLWSPYYQPYYGYYDPFYYNDWYYPYNSYNYWGYNPYYNRSYYGYWGHNTYYNRSYSQPHGQRYAASSALGRNRNYYQQYNNTYREGYLSAPTASKKNVVATRPQETRQAVNTQRQNKPTYNQSNRTYTPSYSNPRMATRPQYNNSNVNRNRITTTTRPESRGVQQSTQNRNIITRPSSNAQRSTVTRTPVRTQSRTYSTPQRSQSYSKPATQSSRSYSTPSRSVSSGSVGRSSSGSVSRSSSGSSTGKSKR